ncbi:hypothetical protein O6H91_Y530200 [Diphasiastrum complanatum]|nr:hypothetical protein O6H91_Y530200 [Diphasiastrum complanatum]
MRSQDCSPPPLLSGFQRPRPVVQTVGSSLQGALGPTWRSFSASSSSLCRSLVLALQRRRPFTHPACVLGRVGTRGACRRIPALRVVLCSVLPCGPIGTRRNSSCWLPDPRPGTCFDRPCPRLLSCV